MKKNYIHSDICCLILVARAYHSQCLAPSFNRYSRAFWRFLACLISVLLLSATHARAVTITVTNGNDSGQGSLRQAILDASSGDTINFAPSLTVINLTSGALVINKNLTITGPAINHLVAQRSIAAPFPILDITAGVVAEISGLTISNGGVGGDNSQGGIYSEGYVVVTNCVLSNNVTAGVYITGALTISNSTICHNGEGIINLGDTDITNCTIADNIGSGGIYNGANMTIYSSTISGNSTSSDGAGVGNDGFLDVTNSTISDNTASGYGGGIRNGNNISNSGFLGIKNSTINGNSSANGGGIYNYSTLSATVNSTLIALNSAPSGPDGAGTFASRGYNLVGKRDGTTGFTQPTDQTGTIAAPLDPRLDPAGLQNNGGPTPTVALLADGPAINRGDPVFSPGLDQRGYGRVGIPDVGAFELDGGSPRYDFNSDGKPDYVLYKASTRQTAIWYLNNNVHHGSNYGPTLPIAWTVIDVADFNRDAHPDYLLYNGSTRQTAIWYLNNSDYRGGAYGPSAPNGWQPVATADFNGDGKPDYALYNSSTRQTAIWYLNNNVYVSGAYGPTLPAGWRLVGSTDFNGDRKPDYLLFNSTTRQSAIWYLDHNVYVSGAYGPTIASGYTLVRTADFNSDGHPDYVLYNPASRQTAIWYLNNNVYVSAAYGPTPPAGWSLVAP
jgi:FG-GAP-like repeat